jgi:hypothetical protein
MLALRAALAALLALAAAPAVAQERITSFASDIAVQEDSSVEVTETIDIVSEGDRIRRGIYRELPTRYRGAGGRQVRVGFDFHGATRNGRPEPAAVEPMSNGVRIRIGSADTLIDPGRHRYVIRYRTTRQIGRFADFDELYWNATGSGWEFPIEVAQARIRLPSPITFIQKAAYTGPQGSTDSNAQVVSEQPGEILFRTTWPLAPFEGLTIAAAWPKGAVAQADERTRLGWWIADYGPPIVGGFGLLTILAFYYVAWQRAGRDPRPGPMVPLFTPPDELSPPAMRYIVEMNADNRAFAAALVDMGVRGHVRIHEEGGGWLSSATRKIERLAGSEPLPQEQEEALAQLVSTGETIEMQQKNHAKFSAARNELEKVLKKRFEGVMFHRNYGWAAAGVAVLIAALWLSAATVALSTGIFTLPEIGVPVGAILTTVLLLLFVNKLGSVGNCLLVGGAVLFAFLGLALGLPLLFEALNSGWWLPFALPALSIPLVLSGF